MALHTLHPPNSLPVDRAGFRSWTHCWGTLLHRCDPDFPSTLYGFENISPQNRDKSEATLSPGGATFGFVQSGSLQLTDHTIDWVLQPMQWFALPNGAQLRLQTETRVVVMRRLGFCGTHAMGGPIEEFGRLRYIDGCSDTLLCAPPLLGDPCLNYLHFPVGIDQTLHTHPSVRLGIVARGQGTCVTPEGDLPLSPGMIFCIEPNGLHKFRTEFLSMDVIAYHPESDWGPTHEEHPMINRTLVDGSKMDNRSKRHRPHELAVSSNKNEF